MHSFVADPGPTAVLTTTVLQICGVQYHRPTAVHANKAKVDRMVLASTVDPLLFFQRKDKAGQCIPT